MAVARRHPGRLLQGRRQDGPHVPGDRRGALLDPRRLGHGRGRRLDQLLGRGSQCINTGGEKVYPEEVEEAIKRHPAVEDCLVFGVPDERFGQRVVGVAVARAGRRRPTADDILVDAARTRLSSYKVPRRCVVVDTVPRAPNGKADYRSARQLFADATVAPPS